MIAVILGGEPGVGKGDQMELLPKIPFMRGFQRAASMGPLLTAAARNGDPCAEEIRMAQHSGKLVSDATTTRIFMDAFSAVQQDSLPRFVSDGFPRTLGQYEALRNCLFGRGFDKLIVIEITLFTGHPGNDEEARSILTNRAWNRLQKLMHLPSDSPLRRPEKPVKNREEMRALIDIRLVEYFSRTKLFLEQARRDAARDWRNKVYHFIVYGHASQIRIHVDIATKLKSIVGSDLVSA